MNDANTTIDPACRAESIRSFYGNSPRTSEWLTVTQDLVDQYCRSVLDEDWMHTDVERARQHGPFGGTVAPGFWTLSMLPYLARKATVETFPPDALFGINYGFDRIRFPGPVVVGSRIRLNLRLMEVTPRETGRYLVRTENSVEVEGQDRPALVAEWMFLLAFPV